MPTIRLIALDLDGTLLTSERTLAPGVKEAVEQALSRGVYVCLASGRSVSSMYHFAESLGLAGPFVSCNGAFAQGPDGEEVHHRTLDWGSADKVLSYARANDIHANVYTKRDVHFSNDGHWAQIYRDRTGVLEKSVADASALKELDATKILLIDEREAMIRHQEETSKLLGDSGANIVRSEAEYIEFLPKGVNKAFGLQAVASALSLQRHQVAAIGDYDNDLEMIQWAGLSGAVSNAAPDIIEHADMVMPSNNDGGAAEFILAALSHVAEL